MISSALLRTYRAVNICIKNNSLSMVHRNYDQGQSLLLAAGMQVRQAHNENNQNIAANLFNDPLRHIDYNQLIAKQKNEAAIVIDVREPQELAETGTIPNSIHIPLGGVSQALELAPEDFRKKYGAEKPSKEALIVFSCRSGNRSKDALFKALLLGYENAAHYTGGWLDWESKTNPRQ